MPGTTKAPSGRHIWKGLRDELMLNLYPLPFSTLAPGVYHVYLHPDEFQAIEPVAQRIVAEVQRALTKEVEAYNAALDSRGRRALARLLQRDELSPIEIPAGGWEIHLTADRNGEIAAGQLGIVSTLAMPAPAEYGGTPTTRIVKSLLRNGRRTSSVTESPAPIPAAATAAPAAAAQDAGVRARLTYADEQGRHVFLMRKDTISVGRGGSSAWVDVQVAAGSRVSREHVRIRRDAAGAFFVQDVSLWGTTLDGETVPPAVKGPEGVSQPGAEKLLPPQAEIKLADVVTITFEAAAAGE